MPTPQRKKLKLLLHAQDGSFPFFSEYLLRIYFNPDDELVKDHLIIGIAVKDTCVVPCYKPREEKRTKRKRSAKDATKTKAENKTETDSSSTSNAVGSKPSGYTFDGEPVNKQTRLLPGYQTFFLPTFDLVDDARALALLNAPKQKSGKYQGNKNNTNSNGDFNPSAPAFASASSTNDKLSLNTPNGMQQITPELYAEVASKMQCQSMLALYDQAHAEEKKKRKAVCIDRTKSWLERCLISLSSRKDKDKTPLNMWAALPLSCFDSNDCLKDSLQYLSAKQDELAGITIIGWHHIDSGEERINVVNKLKCKEAFRTDMEFAITSASNLRQILDAAKCGINTIGSATPANWARTFKALALDVGSQDSMSIEAVLEQLSSTSPLDENGCIDVSDEIYFRDSSPLLPGCNCPACKNSRYTRSYLHHLIKAKELLAQILLFGHNLHQMLLLMQKLSCTAEVEESS